MYNDYTKKINGDGVNRSIYIVLSEIIHEWNKQVGLLTMTKLKSGVMTYELYVIELTCKRR